MTNAEKRDYLREYKSLDVRIDRLQAEKEKWEERATRITPTYSDMPRGGGCADKLQDAVIHIIDLEREITTDIDRLVDMRRKIEASIQTVSDERLREILRLRYIDGETEEKTAESVGINDIRWLRRLTARALSELTLLNPVTPVI